MNLYIEDLVELLGYHFVSDCIADVVDVKEKMKDPSQRPRVPTIPEGVDGGAVLAAAIARLRRREFEPRITHELQ